MNELTERYHKAKKMLFDKVYGARLNSEQCRAVFTAKGPLLVLAGAGSGKTTVLVNRIAYLIKYGDAYLSEECPMPVDRNLVEALEYAINYDEDEITHVLDQLAYEPVAPWSILAITFTNKAAKEIKDRLDRAFGDKSISDAIWAGTFHSVCVRILRRYGSYLGYRDGFSIYDTDDKKRMITQCMRELEISEKILPPRAVANEISRAKDQLISAEEYQPTHDPRTRDIAKIYTLYQKKMMEYNAVDFDDIIMKTVELLRSEPQVLEYYQDKLRYILVDEYQDTNHAQFVLVELLGAKHRNVMVVGDDDQSIYRFRGATVENILGFDKTYPDATVIKLEQNYRSTENILAAANSIIRNNDKRHKKELWCKRGEGELITLYEARDQNDEARYIIDKINTAVKTSGKNYSDFAVLYRTNALGRALQTVFAKSGMPYKVVGDMSFYERKEVKDMIAYLSVVGSEGDNLRLKRIINEPKRKIGPACLEAVEAIATRDGLPMYEVVKRCAEYDILSKNVSKLTDFANMIESLRSRELSPSELVGAIFEESGYHDMLKSEGFEGEGKIEIVKEFISAASEYEARVKEADEEPSLTEFLEELALISGQDKYDENADAATLMTVHAAKGLEFPVVFIAGMEDGIFPSEQSRSEPDGISEERRLAYVAITRAKEKLYVTHAHERLMYGKSSGNFLSQFIRKEMDEALISREGARRGAFGASSAASKFYTREPHKPSSEFKRAPSISAARPSPASVGSRHESFGLRRIKDGSRVAHSVFGEGVVVSSRDLGGDILYEVRFASGETKKLMATYAHLKEI